MIVVNPPGPCISIIGSANGTETPKALREGPMPRTVTRLAAFPVMMKPAIKTLSPVPTLPRVEMLPSRAAGVAVGVAVGEGVGVAVAAGVAVAVGEGVGGATTGPVRRARQTRPVP